MSVSLNDARCQCKQYEVAKPELQNLISAFRELQAPDCIEQLQHVRTLIVWSRMCHSTRDAAIAKQAWEAVLHAIEKYNTFLPDGLTKGCVNLSLSLLSVREGELAAAQKRFDVAARILSTGEKERWMPKLAAWTDTIADELTSCVGWTIL